MIPAGDLHLVRLGERSMVNRNRHGRLAVGRGVGVAEAGCRVGGSVGDWVARTLVGAGVGAGVVAPVMGRGLPVAEGLAVGWLAAG